MAHVVLNELWINLVSTGDAVHAHHKPYAQRSASVDGSVQTYAGGRRRGIYRIGTGFTFPFTLLRVGLADMLTLESWIGQIVQVRDWRGQRIYGQYWKVDSSLRRPYDMYEPTITLESVSYQDGI